MPILDTIKQRSIWLFSPAPGQLKVWNLITAEDWESHARPGMQLGMSISTANFSGSLLRRGVSIAKIEAAVSFETPLPHFAPYPEDAKFRFLYELFQYFWYFHVANCLRARSKPNHILPILANTA